MIDLLDTIRGGRTYDGSWLRWRLILDKIVSNKHYDYDDPQKHVLINLAHFAQEELAHYNYLFWKSRKEVPCEQRDH
jgi:hypothetical protein